MNLRRFERRYIYDIFIDIDLSTVSPNVKKMMDSVNNTMHDFGFNEKATIISTTKIFELSTCKELTIKDKSTVETVINDALASTRSGIKWIVKDIKLKE